jgi:hypothetical protein
VLKLSQQHSDEARRVADGPVAAVRSDPGRRNANDLSRSRWNRATVHGTFRAEMIVMGTLAVMVASLVAVLVVMPAWRYSAKWGYYPAGVCGMVALAIVALVFAGRL